MSSFLIYGATGYTGRLMVREAVARRQHPILGGRDGSAVAALAGTFGLKWRAFSLEEPDTVARGIAGANVVLNCAGPFARTAQPLADACLRTGIHYLDITGEAQTFESLAARDSEARAAGVMLLPGAGFDVVPSDCLAVHLKRRLPLATHLALGFLATGRMSRGTATTVMENLARGGLVRQAGVLRPVPAAWKTRVIDFGTGPVKAVTIPWGDVVTAYYSTGIPNIEVYAAMPLGRRLAARLLRSLGWVLASSAVQDFLRRRIQAGPPGPTDAERERGQSLLWGEMRDEAGQRVVSRLRGPEGYTFTVQTALAIIERVLAGQAPVGFQTPATAFGPDFVLSIPGVVREDDRSMA